VCSSWWRGGSCSSFLPCTLLLLGFLVRVTLIHWLGLASSRLRDLGEYFWWYTYVALVKWHCLIWEDLGVPCSCGYWVHRSCSRLYWMTHWVGGWFR
jgi:hypothetical protein